MTTRWGTLWRSGLLVIAALAVSVASTAAPVQTTGTLTVRGHQQTLHLYGTRGSTPIIVSSGDGGWIHLGPHVADTLAAHGYFVVGFDVKAYLASFTGKNGALNPSDEPSDYQQLIAYTSQGGSEKPILIGVSEGAGLSVLAAADPAVRPSIGGVLGLGLPDRNELGWRWRDAITYLTHATPNESTFSVAPIIGRLSPLPVAAIHSSHDEFVPLSDIQRIMDAAHQPKRLWVIGAADHRFSDNLADLDARLIDAIDWMRNPQPRP